MPFEEIWTRYAPGIIFQFSVRTTIRREAEALAEKQWTATVSKITVGMKIFSISAKELVEKYLADFEDRVRQGLNRKGLLDRIRRKDA